MSPRRPPMRWSVAECPRAETAALARALDVPRVVARLLIQRGYGAEAAARRFLNPTADALSDPFSLTGMRDAVERITRARDTREKLLVFGDYDVDGITGTAVLLNALERFGVERRAYGLPDRLTEGYGLSAAHVEQAAADDVSLIVTVDNGISAHAAAERARSLGVNLIVTDHHSLPDTLPEACAVINPKRESPDHPAYETSGAAVAHRLGMALTGESADLDLVALGVVADIVPLLGENRNLVAAGLAQMSAAPRPGLEALAKVARIDLAQVTSENIAYHLGPRINAGGRLGNGHAGLALLRTQSPEEALNLAKDLDAANEERRQIEADICEEAEAELAKQDRGEPVIVLAKRGWRAGVIGIVASRLQRAHSRPVILIAIGEDGVGKGSGRSIPGFNLVEALQACAKYLEKFGGHHAAAGLTVRAERIPPFRDAFESEARRLLEGRELAPELAIDAVVSLSEVDGQLIRALERFQPCGQGNPAPRFCSYGVETIPNSFRELRGGHLRGMVRGPSGIVTAIGFGMADRLETLRSCPQVDIAFAPQLNTWRGETSVQLVLKDIRPAEK